MKNLAVEDEQLLKKIYNRYGGFGEYPKLLDYCYHYYPKWKEAHEAYKVLHKEKERIWQNGDLKYVFQEYVKSKLRPLKDAYIHFKFQKGK